MSNVNQNGLAITKLERTLGMPEEGPKCVPVGLDFSVAPAYVLDFQNMNARNFMTMVQTLWVDNFANTQILVINIPSSQQTLRIPAGLQGYFPVLCPNAPRFEFSSTGTAFVQVTLLNFPVMAA